MSDPTTAPRILFYCHNAIGLGHVIRSLRIAGAAMSEGARCAIVTGCRFLSTIDVDPRIEVEVLPPVRLEEGGRPVPLVDDGSDIIAVRGRRIVELIERWQPDAVVVDHHPLGLGGELVDTLVADNGTRFFLGIPYIEAIPTRPFRNPRLQAALSRYRDLLDYSDDGAGASVTLNGVTATRVGIVSKPPLPPVDDGQKRVVALAGGGYGAADVYRIVINAMRELPSWRLRLLVGPFGDNEAVQALARERDGVEVWVSGTAEDAIRDATVVVARSGYNTSYTLVQSDRPVIFIPQRLAGDDQGSRAERLAALPKVWSLDTREPDVSGRLAALLHGADLTPLTRTLPFRVDGASAAAREIIHRILEERGSRQERLLRHAGSR
jgi:predicted glycosyltransferase